MAIPTPAELEQGAREWTRTSLAVLQTIVDDMVKMDFHPLCIKTEKVNEHVLTIGGYHLNAQLMAVALLDKEERLEEIHGEVRRRTESLLKQQMEQAVSKATGYYSQHTKSTPKSDGTMSVKSITVAEIEAKVSADPAVSATRAAYKTWAEDPAVIAAWEEWQEMKHKRRLQECLVKTLDKLFHLLPGTQRQLNESIDRGT